MLNEYDFSGFDELIQIAKDYIKYFKILRRGEKNVKPKFEMDEIIRSIIKFLEQMKTYLVGEDEEIVAAIENLTKFIKNIMESTEFHEENHDEL